MKKINLEFFCFVLWCFLFLFSSCTAKKQDEDIDLQQVKENSIQVSQPISTSTLIHYWDDYNFKNGEIVNNFPVLEQALINFIGLFPASGKEEISSSIRTMLEKAAVNKEVFNFFKDKYEKYLYDAASPLRNDVYYLSVLEYLVSTPHLSNIEKLRYKMLLELVNKNMPDSVITDFNFLNISGESQSLHHIQSTNKLLLFYDPACPHCAETIAEIGQDPNINTLVNQGKLKIVAICPVGEIKQWKAYRQNIPSNWINGFDKNAYLMKKKLYDIKAFPTLFLIDEKNKVILKDPSLEQFLGWFNR
ncbi:DUF5106 domain-containing protein [Elizabethkingia argentiflava]|uniref:DUF5106 domain-containing protein n=2 Tax=Elizabethkingia argenteiflava TaxID=2681556 RepID=A0A845PU28_9FLAO|nr:DUF5106 domain-containing protein [Elizabethkingia argenteiflava]